MAMSKCKECGKAVSTLAKTCPNCGVPKPTLKKNLSKKNLLEKTIFYSYFKVGFAHP